MLWWLATWYFWMQTTIMMHKDSTIWCPCKDGNLKIKYNNHHDHMVHRPALLHLNQLRRGINVMFISERFCNPLLHFKMTKDDEMPKVEEMAAVTLTNILWETCRNILGLHWQIHHGSVWQPDQYDQMIKQGGGAEDIRVNPVRGVGSTCITMRKSILQKNTCSIEIYKTWICPPDFCRRVPQPPVFSSPLLTRLALLSLSRKDFLSKMDRQESNTLRCFFRSGSLATAMVWPWMGSFSLWLWKSSPKLQIRRESGQPVSWVSRVNYCRAGIAAAWGSPRKLNRVGFSMVYQIRCSLPENWDILETR